MSTENRVQSFDVGSTLSAKRVVAVDAANQVGYPGAATTLPIGVTIDDVTETNQAIAVAGPGSIVELLFNDTVSAAGLVAADTSGRGIPNPGTVTSAYVGVLVGAAVAATGTVAKVLVQPGFGGA